MYDLQTLKPVFLEAASLASRRICSIYESDFSFDEKADKSPVTEADLEGEAAILDHLADQIVSIPVVSEESVAAGVIPEITDSYILVDPLDGTREFISRNGEFTVNIGLIADGEPVLGVVLLPALNEAFWGTKGEGAFKAPILESADAMLAAAQPVHVVDVADSDWRAVASRSHLSEETTQFIERNKIANTVNFGSSLKFCRLAEGAADVYPRLSPTNQWDIAAGDAVLRAAGGATIGMDGAPFVYKVPRPLRAKGFLNPWFVACGGFDPTTITL